MITRTIFDSCVKKLDDVSQPHLEPLGAVVVRCMFELYLYCYLYFSSIFIAEIVLGVSGALS